MAKQAVDFYRLFVLPAWKDYQANPRSLRHAMVLAIGLHHLTDYLAMETYSGPDGGGPMREVVSQLRASITSASEDFRLIGDIADASKHSRLSVSKNTPRLVLDSEQLRSPPGIFGAPFGTGVFNEAAYLYIEQPGRPRTAFQPVAAKVMAMWQQLLDVESE